MKKQNRCTTSQEMYVSFTKSCVLTRPDGFAEMDGLEMWSMLMAQTLAVIADRLTDIADELREK